MRLLAALSLFCLPALAEVPVVVTDIPPVHALVAQVMGDLGQPVLLLDPGADEHDFQLRPSQMQSLESAGLIVWIGPGLTPWLARVVTGTSAPTLTLIDLPETHTQGYPDEQDTAPGNKASDTGLDADTHEGTNTGGDPHVWLNPENAALWLPRIAAELAKADPANAATYAANARAAVVDIATLDAEITALLAPVAAVPFATHHNAYGYFASHFGLAYAGAITNGEASASGAAHLAQLHQRLTDDHIRCLFPEAQHDPALAAQLREGTQTKLGGPLDPVGSTLEPGPKAYANLLRGIATTLLACLQG